MQDVEEFSDTSSGAKFSRDGLDALMREVRKGRIDAVVAYKLDRLRRSLPHLAQLVGEMTAHRVALVIPAQGIDTSASNPASQLQLNILMSVAEFEREIIRERNNSGLRAAGRAAFGSAEYYVLRNCRLPAVLVECGFLTNPVEAQLALTPEYRETVAEQIAGGITEQRQFSFPPLVPNHQGPPGAQK
jgi:DNA invertase Pin-like site-specific DNA recombinase